MNAKINVGSTTSPHLVSITERVKINGREISEKDFDDWVEERGSKWWSEWDARYKPLLKSHDREQPLQKGGMMYAEYGKGTWVYAGYAFYRQLPAGVQGGYRLFANLISLQKRSR